MVVKRLKDNQTWLYHLAVFAPAVLFVVLALILPDPAGFDGRAFKPYQLNPDLAQTADIKFAASAAEQAWLPLEERHYHGLMGDGQPVWYRVTIPPQRDAQQMRAEVGYHLLRKADWYATQDGVVVGAKAGGMERPRDQESLFCRLDFAAHPNKPTQLYLRLETDVAVVAPLFIGGDREFHEFDMFRRWTPAAMVGIVTGFVVYSLTLLLTLRQPIYASLLMSNIGALTFPLVFSGQILNYGTWFPQGLSVQILVLCELILIPQYFLLMTNRYYVARDTGRRKTGGIEKLVTVLTVTLIFVSPFFTSSPALLVLVAFSNMGTTAILLVSSMRWQVQKMMYYRMFLCTFVCSEIISSGSWLGWFPASFYNHYFVEFGLVVGALILSTAMTNRIRHLELKHREIVKSLRHGQSKTTGSLIGGGTSEELSVSREIDVTIMYVDIVSFSVIADQTRGKSIFADLSRRLASLSKIITEHNGIIDRSLGDALLCFFANREGGAGNHAHDAFRAAHAIQGMLIEEAKKIKNSGHSDRDPLLPVRIGLHSDKVLLANLGGGVRVDFTMVGQGVNFVSSLEQACGPFNVMISSQCYTKLISDGHATSRFAPVWVSMKHHKDLILAYEYNPAYDRPDDFKEALAVYYAQIEVHQRDERMEVAEEAAIHLKSQGYTFTLLDYSPNGMRLLADVYFAQKVVLEFDLDLGSEHLNGQLKAKMLDRLIAEVRWSRKSAHGYEHGIKLLGGNRKQLELLLKLLSERRRSWLTDRAV